MHLRPESTSPTVAFRRLSRSAGRAFSMRRMIVSDQAGIPLAGHCPVPRVEPRVEQCPSGSSGLRKVHEAAHDGRRRFRAGTFRLDGRERRVRAHAREKPARAHRLLQRDAQDAGNGRLDRENRYRFVHLPAHSA